MKLLEEKILNEGQIEGNDILKVDMFLNHQVDIEFLNEIGKEFKRLFSDKEITKIVTIETSGIAIACITAQYFNVPLVYAKKGRTRTTNDELYVSSVYSFTHLKTYNIGISKKALSSQDKILIIDDFLANGHAVSGLLDISNQAGAKIMGVGIVIEKAFQDGGERLRKKGLDIQSLAVLKSISDGKITFADD